MQLLFSARSNLFQIDNRKIILSVCRCRKKRAANLSKPCVLSVDGFLTLCQPIKMRASSEFLSKIMVFSSPLRLCFKASSASINS